MQGETVLRTTHKHVHDSFCQTEHTWRFSAGIKNNLPCGWGLTPYTSLQCMTSLCILEKWEKNKWNHTQGLQIQKFPSTADMTFFSFKVLFFLFHLLLTPHWIWYFQHTQVRKSGVNVPTDSPTISPSQSLAPGLVCINAPIMACHHFNK